MSTSAAGPRTRSFFRGASINLLYVPALVLFAVFTIYPLISGAGLSLTNWDGYSEDRGFVGLTNYLRLFTDSTFLVSLVNTLIYGVGSTLIQQVLGLGLALALDRPLRGRGVARAIIYLPVLVSPVIMGTFYYLIFQYNDGVLNDIVTTFGGDRIAWLSNSVASIGIIVVVNSLQFVGVSMIIYLAGLQSIPTMYHEASLLDGAGPRKQFLYVTLPLLRPAFVTSITLNLIGGLKIFDVIKVLTGGGPGYSTNSVSTIIGKTYFDNQMAGYAATIGIALFVIIAAVTALTNRLLDRRPLED